MKNIENTVLLTEEEFEALEERAAEWEAMEMYEKGDRHLVIPFPFDHIVKYLTNMPALSPVLPREHLHYTISVEGCQGVFVKKVFCFFQKKVLTNDAYYAILNIVKEAP